ncbi:hypothetical protein A2U01_0117874, partial [Trifolium medium]|nr:hypothetical protein [Trifolium medium]
MQQLMEDFKIKQQSDPAGTEEKARRSKGKLGRGATPRVMGIPHYASFN